MSKLPETLNEFMDDGGKFQMARPSDGTWTSVHKEVVRFGQIGVVTIEGGYTSTTNDSHTAVINVTVKPLALENGAEDQAVETITVYYKEFKSEDEARMRVKSVLKGELKEENPGVPPESQSLGIQLATQRGAGTIAI